MNKKQEKFLILIISAWTLGLLVLFVFLPKKEISTRERRRLAGLPDFNISNLIKGNFINDIDKYIQDHFPFRDKFQDVKIVLDKAFLKLQSNGYGEYDGYIISIPKKFDLDQYEKTADYYKQLSQKLFKNQKKFFSLIPDKNFYIDSNIYPKIDYKSIDGIFSKAFGEASNIDISKSLTLSDFYKSDLHWKQERLAGVVDEILKKLDLKKENYKFANENLGSFYGAYGSASGKSYIKDDLIYLQNEMMSDYQVRDMTSNKLIGFYNKDMFNSIDPYSVFLSGPRPLIEIKKNSFTQKSQTLYIFRDSFSSSLAPLLSLNFDRIILIDSRYVSSKILEKNISPNEDDMVLILLSYEIIKDPSILKS